jgi:ATP-dependent helicase STH1/SNF2
LKALKADDEEAYMKLIDAAKDTCITHLLRQTDYSTWTHWLRLSSHSQNDDVHKDTRYTREDTSDETAFGTQELEKAADEKGRVDYYGIAHRIKGKVDKQPSILWVEHSKSTNRRVCNGWSVCITTG